MITPPPNLQAQCPYCDTPITVHQKINPGYCGAAECLHKHAVHGDQLHRAAWLEKYEGDVAVAKERFLPEIEAQAAEAGIASDRIYVGAVPYTVTRMSPLPEDQRTAYLTHLSEITETAFASALPGAGDVKRTVDAQQGEPHPWNNAACGTCRGRCCKHQGGRYDAFQTVEHIQHMRQTRPEMSADDIIAHFTNALPEVSNEGSCVFHGPQGCVLERTDRADVCNTFRCDALERLAEDIQPDTVDAIALVSVGDAKAHDMNILMKRTE